VRLAAEQVGELAHSTLCGLPQTHAVAVAVTVPVSRTGRSGVRTVALRVIPLGGHPPISDSSFRLGVIYVIYPTGVCAKHDQRHLSLVADRLAD
jgi:hypothetical protein